MEFKSQEEKKLMLVMFKTLGSLLKPNLVCDKDGVILFANEAYHEEIKKNPVKQVFWKIFPLSKSMPVYFKEAVEQCNETRSETSFKDRRFLIRIIPVNDVLADEVVYIVYFNDITLNVKFKQELKFEKSQLQKSFLSSILAFSDFVESRDSYTSGHQKRVAVLSLNIAKSANITDPRFINAIYYGALLHDIGKIAIPMDYLVTPRRLSENEFEILKTHVAIGNKIIEHVDFPWDIKSVVFQHHERLDGSGYPNGIRDKDITIPAKIVAIADVYEAMSTDRPYRKSIEKQTIIEHLRDNRGLQFDAYYVDCLLQCISNMKDIYEMGSNFRPFDLLN